MTSLFRLRLDIVAHPVYAVTKELKKSIILYKKCPEFCSLLHPLKKVPVVNIMRKSGIIVIMVMIWRKKTAAEPNVTTGASLLQSQAKSNGSSQAILLLLLLFNIHTFHYIL